MDKQSLDAEQQAFENEVEAVKQWWKDDRWRYTKRPYTAEQIVNKRGTIKQEYPNNQMSKKLWNLLEEKFKVCEEGRVAATSHWTIGLT